MEFEKEDKKMENMKNPNDLLPGDILYRVFPTVELCKLDAIKHGGTGTVSYYFNGFETDRPCLFKMFKNYGNKFFIYNE